MFPYQRGTADLVSVAQSGTPLLQLGNQIRGLLAEYAIIVPLHLSQGRLHFPALLSEENHF